MNQLIRLYLNKHDERSVHSRLKSGKSDTKILLEYFERNWSEFLELERSQIVMLLADAQSRPLTMLDIEYLRRVKKVGNRIG